jgi:hypothetical protein
VAFFHSRSKQQLKNKTKAKTIFRKMAAQNVCRYNKFGYCKFGEVCRKQHVDELCDDSSCDPLNCIKRHPKECKYYSNYKRCKFNPCKFLHLKNENYDEKLKEISKKQETIEENLQEKINIINLKIKEIDEKIDIHEEAIKAIEKVRSF